MKILVIAATKMEIEPFIKLNNTIEVLICGVGIPSTVYHLTKKLFFDKYDIIIQAGIAGTFIKKIKKGDVVVVNQDVFADLGIEEKKGFKTIFDLGFDDKNKNPFTNGWLNNKTEILDLSTLKKVNAVTVNKISDKKKQTKQIQKKFKAAIETMEGAAFHYVCLQHNIPFIQLRSISNKVGERDKTKWKMKEAIENLNTELINLINLFK